MAFSRNIMTSLDVGTHSIRVLVAEQVHNYLKILGHSTLPHSGVKLGQVVHLEKTIQTIKKALQEAEDMAQIPIQKVWVGYGGGMQVKAYRSKGMAPLVKGEVFENELDQVLKMAEVLSLPEDQCLVQTVPQSFSVDHQKRLENPKGMTGVRLECDAMLLTASRSHFQNYVKATQSAQVDLAGFIFSGVSGAQSVLREDEKRMGSCYLDWGAGTLDMSIYIDGSLIHVSSLPIGGEKLTRELAVGLQISPTAAEAMKNHHGICGLSPRDSERKVELEFPDNPDLNRSISLKAVSETMEPSILEAFKWIRATVEGLGLKDQIPAGYVFAGGTSSMKGLIERAQVHLDHPVRLGIPSGVFGMPESIQQSNMAHVVGLLLCGREPIYRRETSWTKVGTYNNDFSKRLSNFGRQMKQLIRTSK